MADEILSASMLTLPEEIHASEKFFMTGNEFVALPEMRGGRQRSLNVLHTGLCGLLELRGDAGHPVIEPFVTAATGQVSLPAEKAVTRLEQDWLPETTWRLDGATFGISCFAPPGYKGFVCVLTWSGAGADWLHIGIRGRVAAPTLSIFSSRELPATVRFAQKKWLAALACEVVASGATLGLGFCGSTGYAWRLNGTETDALEASAVNYELRAQCDARAGAVAFYVGVNREWDGAACCAVDLKRRGWETLRRETLEWLSAHRLPAPPGGDALLNRNLFFNYFYAQGKTIDTEERVLLTSRSPRYYVSSAFWARDAFLWSFPAILLTDRPLAAEILHLAFTRYLKNAGVHALYLDGTVLYPGFELDEAAAYILALGQYLYTVRDLNDLNILKQQDILNGVHAIEELLFSKKHPDKYLFETFLLPSDDPTPHPYVTYDNAVVWKAFMTLSDIYNAMGKQKMESFYKETAGKLKRTILDECVAESPRGVPLFAWSVDLAGKKRIYDDVPGSLVLLPYLGFCENDFPIYQNTLKWIFSEANPHFVHAGKYAGQTCLHVPRHPWILGWCNALLAAAPPPDGVPWLDRLLAAPMDNGYACETVDAQTGEIRTGAAFATCAGFIAFTLARLPRGNPDGK